MWLCHSAYIHSTTCPIIRVIRSTTISHTIWPTSHMTCKSHDLQVTRPASHMTCKSHDLQVTWPASHMTSKLHDLQVTWLHHMSLSPCLIQGGSGHWESSLMGHSTFPTWIMPLVVRTTDWGEMSSTLSVKCWQIQRTVTVPCTVGNFWGKLILASFASHCDHFVVHLERKQS